MKMTNPFFFLSCCYITQAYTLSLSTHSGHLHPPMGQSYFRTYTAEMLSTLSQETAGETWGKTATGRISEADTKHECSGWDPRSFPKSTSQSTS